MKGLELIKSMEGKLDNLWDALEGAYMAGDDSDGMEKENWENLECNIKQGHTELDELRNQLNELKQQLNK